MQLKLSQTGTSSGLNQRSADYHLLVKSGPPPIFVNKVLLAHSLAYSPIYRLRRRFNKSILKEINPGISLEGMMLKLKLQYFGHLIQRVDSLEKTLMLGGIGGRRRRGRPRMRWLDGITDSMDVSLSEL